MGHSYGIDLDDDTRKAIIKYKGWRDTKGVDAKIRRFLQKDVVNAKLPGILRGLHDNQNHNAL